MSIEQDLKAIVKANYGTVKEFAKQAGLPYGTVDTIFRRGIAHSNMNNVAQICATLNIDADYLINQNAIVEAKKDEDKIESLSHRLNYYRLNMMQFQKFEIDGKPLTTEEAEMLLNAVDITIEMIRRKRETQ